MSLFCHQSLDFSKVILLHKTFKAAKLVMADGTILNCTKNKLLAINK